MTKKADELMPTFLELERHDDAAIDEFAKSLGVTSDEVRGAIDFGREILSVGSEQRQLSRLQILQAAMGAVVFLVRTTLSPDEQREHCASLFSDMMAYCESQPSSDNGIVFAASNPWIIH